MHDDALMIKRDFRALLKNQEMAMSDSLPASSGNTGRYSSGSHAGPAAAAFRASVIAIGALTLAMASYAAPSSAPLEDDRSREAARDPLGFEECAKRELQVSSDVRDVLRACEAEANAYIARQPHSQLSSPQRSLRPQDAEVRAAQLERSPLHVGRRALAQTFEACARTSFSEDQSVREVFVRCDNELQQYLNTFSEAERTVISSRVRVATHHALTEQSLEAAQQREDES